MLPPSPAWHATAIDSVDIVCGTASVERSRVRPSVRWSVCSIVRPCGGFAAEYDFLIGYRSVVTLGLRSL